MSTIAVYRGVEFVRMEKEQQLRAHGVFKGGTKWKRTFTGVREMKAWTDTNDAEVLGSKRITTKGVK